jgi:hypothetical protein
MRFNREIFDKAFTYIMDHPEEWDQRTWGKRDKCGTAFCLGGTIAIQNGYVPVWSHHESCDSGCCPEHWEFEGVQRRGGRGNVVRHAQDVANELLFGEQDPEYHGLYTGNNKLSDLYRKARDCEKRSAEDAVRDAEINAVHVVPNHGLVL